MSYLKITFKMVLMGLLVSGLAACDNDGAFKAADHSIKEVAQPDRPVLNEEQIKALHAETERRANELSEEIALKNETVSGLQVRLEQSQTEINALNEKMLEVLASDMSADEKTREVNSLREQITVLTEQINSDRAQYNEALLKAKESDAKLTEVLTVLRNEIQRLENQQGTINDAEVARIMRDVTATLEERVARMESDSQRIASEIAALNAKIAELEAKAQALEAAAANSSDADRPALEQQALDALKETTEAQSVLNDALEEQAEIDSNIVQIKCDKPEDCENVDVTVEGSGNTVSVTVEGQGQAAVATPSGIVEPDLAEEIAAQGQETAPAVVAETPVSTATPVAAPSALVEVEARRAEALSRKQAEIVAAEESKQLLRAEIQDVRTLIEGLRTELSETENATFDVVLEKEKATSDSERVALDNRIKELNDQKRQLLVSIGEAEGRIRTIQEGDLAQIEARLTELRRQRIDLMRR